MEQSYPLDYFRKQKGNTFRDIPIFSFLPEYHRSIGTVPCSLMKWLGLLPGERHQERSRLILHRNNRVSIRWWKKLVIVLFIWRRSRRCFLANAKTLLLREKPQRHAWGNNRRRHWESVWYSNKPNQIRTNWTGEIRLYKTNWGKTSWRKTFAQVFELALKWEIVHVRRNES